MSRWNPWDGQLAPARPPCADRAHGITILSQDRPVCRVCHCPVGESEVKVRTGVTRLDEAIRSLVLIERDSLLDGLCTTEHDEVIEVRLRLQALRDRIVRT